jgi:ferrous iron transport protein A
MKNVEKTLIELIQGEEATIVSIQGGHGLQTRLRDLGLVEGQRVRKLSALAWGGPVVVDVKRTQVAIGRGMARRIVVRCTNGEK